MCRRLTPLASGLLAALGLALAPVASAADGDHDRARGALERGEILPLAQILAVAVAHVPGRIIEVELERDDGRWIYEVELLTRGGRLVEIEIDGATGRILEIEADDEWDD
ncbi:PepSY domain-containing protein [Histidinibacterium lentulum]|uniref:Peptidase n=1 Tax=Histidinibacterium lentulum TaxID=2480588 RepID=A0A3N2QWI2_9RHOB|nr:PepSY domain-containing protein [Histidinibacterium lentulum]ROT99425.1 peptidase [Histidinibacterium lentulum]